jgi:hypothetical protein
MEGGMRYFWLWRWLGYEAIAAAAYWSVRRGYFQVEDFLWLHLSGWRSLLDSFHGSWGYGAAYRPITRLSYWLDGAAFGDWAPGWHFTNVALHGANAALLAVLLERLGLRRSAATAAGLLFTVAPLTAEAVAFISDRTGILCLFFMLLAVLAWLTALRRPSPAAIAAMTGCALLGAMSYEAGFILPGVFVCLAPLALRQTAAPLGRAIRLLGAVSIALAILLGLRGLFLGMMTSTVDGQHPDLLTALEINGPKIGDLFVTSFGPFALGCFAAATIAALAQPRLRFAALAALALSVLLYLPFVTLEGVGDRFFYMVMAPVSVLPVLAANRLEKIGAAVAISLAIALFFPGFLTHTRKNARAISDAGQRTALLKRNILHDLPADNIPSIIDGIPFHQNNRPMFGDFFELAIQDGSKPHGPWAIRADYVEKSPIVLFDLLNRQTYFWQLDEQSQHLIELTKEEWLNRHPEVSSVLATISPDGSGLGMVSQSKDCGSANGAPAAVKIEPAMPVEPARPELDANVVTGSGDGILTLPLNAGFGAFIGSVHNKGAVPHPLTATIDAATLPVSFSICETDPMTALCMVPPTASMNLKLEPGATRTFSVFAKSCAQIPLDRERNRIIVEFADEDGRILTEASLAVRTLP